MALKEKIEGILNKQRTRFTCDCVKCKAKILAAGALECNVCGYIGLYTALECSCLGYECCLENADVLTPSAGCCHGDLVCPVCDDGDGDDAWRIIRETRGALTDE